jgi:aminoglycoside phosphotransferase (APT) family kinase protein
LAGENAPVVTLPALSAAETRAAEALLDRVWGPGTSVRAAEPIWDRTHVVRLHATTGRSVIMKKRAEGDRFEVELAVLEYLNGMPEPVAPRLLGADTDAGIVLMEDLGPGASLADSLLTGDRSRVRADLVSYAEALGAMHAWSMREPRSGLGAPPWPDAVVRGQDAFLDAAASLGLATADAGTDIDQLFSILNDTGYHGLVHGDACPDNVRFGDGRCRIFDFEHSGWGAVALDASYLIAPFPSCWCFGRLPGSVAAPAMSAYRRRLQAAGIDLGPPWDAAMTAALGAWVIAWGGRISKVLEEDGEWGTTTMRPRLLTWLDSFTTAAGRSGVLPGLRVLAGQLHERLSARWPQTVIADYPALAEPGAAQVQVPGFWQPEV